MTAATPPPLTSGEIEELERLLAGCPPNGPRDGFVWQWELATVEKLIGALPRLLSSLKGSAGKEWQQGFDAAKGLMEQFCVRVAADLHDHSGRAKAEGRDHDMYRANTAWHNVTGIIEHIRALKESTDVD